MELIAPFIFVASFCAKGSVPFLGQCDWVLQLEGFGRLFSSRWPKDAVQWFYTLAETISPETWNYDANSLMIKDHLCFNKYAPLEFWSDVSDNSSRQHYIMRCARPLATWQIWSCEYTKAYTRFFPLVAILISMSLATWRCWLAGGHFFASFLTLKEFRFLDSKEADQEQLGVLVEMTETTHHLVLKGNHHS